MRSKAENRRLILLFLLSGLIFSVASLGQAASAKTDSIVIEGDPKPFGNPVAPVKGAFTTVFGVEPSTLNPITGTDLYNQVVTGYVCDSPMRINPETYEWMPALADRVEQSRDGKWITVRIRKGATFHDGKPVTSEDVKFSFDVIFDDKYGAAHLRSYYETIKSAEIVDGLTVRFNLKEKYFKNLDSIAGLTIVPKHIYGDADSGVKKNKNNPLLWPL